MRSGNYPELIVVQFTPTLDTSAYGANDVLFATTAVPGSYKAGYIRGVTIIDKDDVASESATLYFFRSNVTFGTFNAVPSISDAHAADYLGSTGAVVASVDLGGVKVGTSAALAIPFEVVNTGILYVAATTATALTHTASGVVFNIAIERWM